MANVNMHTNNYIHLMGRIANIKEYSVGKAANITLAVDSGKNEDGSQKTPLFIQLKSFTPNCYNVCKTGVKVDVYGHIAPNSYEKNGTKIYNTDLIADSIEFLESKQVVEAREFSK